MSQSASKQYRVAVIPGDGIGREVVPAALRVLAAAAKRFSFALATSDFDFASCDYYDKHGSMMPADWEKQLRPFDAIFFGAVGDPRRMPDHVSLWGSLLQMRRTFDLYCNLRGTRLIPGVPCPLRDPGKIDMVIVRENTEGEYTEMGGKLFHDTDREMVVQETVMTRQGVDRILEYAFTLAASRPAKHLTSATKSNGIALTMPYWDSRVAAMSARFPDVRVDSMHIDALCAAFVSRPASFDVVVGSNLFGDILSDLAPALTGSLGLAASGNIDPTRRSPSVFEAVHGSALDIAGKNVANPVGQIEAGALMLRHLGEEAAADAISKAVDAVLGRGDAAELTRDLGGKGSTTSLAEAVEKELLSA